MNFSELVGKTIVSVEDRDSSSGLGLVGLTISFDDGSELDVSARGCDEGGWLNISGDAVSD